MKLLGLLQGRNRNVDMSLGMWAPWRGKKRIALTWINFAAVSVIQLLNCVQLFAMPSIVAHQAPWSFLRQEYSSGLPFPSPGDLPGPEIKLMPSALSGGFFTAEPQGSTHIYIHYHV